LPPERPARVRSGSGRTQAQPGQDASSYRILILDNLAQPRAQEAKRFLEGLKLPAPVRIDEVNGQYRVTYGDFPTKTSAEQGRAALTQAEGVRSLGVVTAGRPAPALPALATGNEVLTIFVRDFKSRAEAEELKRKLETEYGSVMIRQLGVFYEVMVGQYDAREAAVALGQLVKEGYKTAAVRPLPAAQKPSTPGVVVAPVAPEPSTDIDSPALPVTHLPGWQKLSETDKARVIKNVELQAALRKGDPLAEQMIDISKRLENLDSNLKKLTEDLGNEKKSLDDKRKKIDSMIQDAENNIRSENYKEAIQSLKSALELDKENALNLKMYIERRIEVVNDYIEGNQYHGQKVANKKRAEDLRQRVAQLKISNDTQPLYEAITLLSQIKDLDPDQAKDADAQIAQINQKITQSKESEAKSAEDNKNKLMYTLYGLSGGVAVLLVLVLFVWMRTRKRHMELMRKVQEITSIRPMRELDGSGPQLLGGSDSDIFSPMNPAQEGVAGDPLGGVLTPPPAPDKKAKGKKGKAAAAPAPAAAPASGLDDIFGGANAMPDMGGGDMGLDDLFGSPAPTPAAAPAKAATAKAAAPAAMESAPSGAIDDIFGGLFAEESQAPASKPVTPEAPDDNSPAQETGPISFGDFMTESPEATQTQAASGEGDLLTVFDEPANGSNGSNGKSNGQEVDPLQDSPFGSMFSGEPKKAAQAEPQDDTEIPSIKLDMTAGGATQTSPDFGGLELHEISGASTPGGASLDLPAFSFDDVMGATSVTGGNGGNGSAGVELTFEDEAAGQASQGWEGQYPFAQLTVAADTPPKGTQQYLCFAKQEGAGKAHYSYRFSEVRGTVGIEFDLRCNDKNKFLLGFYVEKDGDFQHSVHTKILRSEAQTSPTIHMQGQSAPYLLGSWTHIKYVVDLNAGVLNGFIDSTHVVRDLPLAPNPGSLNTLSIRDNINTTGVLLLANIKVYQM
jgi:tetratricopeptide (TPR) repeat protein